VIWTSASLDRRRFLTLAVATGAGAVLEACGGTASAPAATKTVHVGDTVAADNPEVTAERYFGQRLSALTDGEYQVKVHPNSELGSHTAMDDQLRSGALEFEKSNSGFLTSFDERLAVWNLPYAFLTTQQLFAAEKGRLGQTTAGILEQQFGIKVLGWFNGGTRNVYNAKGPVRTAADLRDLNLRIRVINDPVYIDTFNTLGARAVPLDTSQIFSALQQGVVNAAENNVIFYVQQHHSEVATYWSWTKHSYSIDPLLVSLKWFQAQPKRVQDAVVQAGHDAEARERQIWTDNETKYAKQAQQAGDKLNDCNLQTFQDAVQPVWQKNSAAFGDLYALLKQSQ
jgi:tripartite ATP-independent transporter DctP family solute receptor